MAKKATIVRRYILPDGWHQDAAPAPKAGYTRLEAPRNACESDPLSLLYRDGVWRASIQLFPGYTPDGKGRLVFKAGVGLDKASEKPGPVSSFVFTVETEDTDGDGIADSPVGGLEALQALMPRDWEFAGWRSRKVVTTVNGRVTDETVKVAVWIDVPTSDLAVYDTEESWEGCTWKRGGSNADHDWDDWVSVG